MPTGFNAHIANLDHLLARENCYRVPEYQRPYSWTTQEADQLLDDLLLALEESGSGAEPGYFLGSILLIDAGPALA